MITPIDERPATAPAAPASPTPPPTPRINRTFGALFGIPDEEPPHAVEEDEGAPGQGERA